LEIIFCVEKLSRYHFGEYLLQTLEDMMNV